jgi:hypothetical protein
MSQVIDLRKNPGAKGVATPKTGGNVVVTPNPKKPDLDLKKVEALVKKLENLLSQLNSKLAPTGNNANAISKLLNGNTDLASILSTLLGTVEKKKEPPALTDKEKKQLAALEKKLETMTKQLLKQTDDMFKKMGIDPSKMKPSNF